MSKKRIIFNWIIFGLAIAVNIFIIVNACLDGATSSKESDGFSHAMADVINSVSEDTITEKNFPEFAGFNRKLFGHFALFALSGLLTTFSIHNFLKDKKLGKYYFVALFSMGFGIVVAAFSELCQLWTKDRGPQFTDVLIDCGGYLLGLLIVIIPVLILYYKKAKLTKN